jgi:hypothetical protein
MIGLWYPLGGVNPLDQARRRPLKAEPNPAAFLCYARDFANTDWRRRVRDSLSCGGQLHDRLFNWVAFLSPAFHAVKHLFHLEPEGGEFRGRLGGCVAEDPVTVCHNDLVSWYRGNSVRVDCSMRQINGARDMSSGVDLRCSRIYYNYCGHIRFEVVVDV